jgi:dTDP-4-dehydrorhamnose 3,5-epimerase
MNIVKTPIEGLLIIEPRVFKDNRGYFFESFNQKKFEESGLNYIFVQDNESLSSYGVVRGLHYQVYPHSQAKLVRAIKGRILDVAVDLRQSSATFGKWFSVELDEENKRQLLIPRGFAHGFSVLSEEAVFAYKCDGIYNAEYERGIIYNDIDLNIDWKIPEGTAKVSDKDLKHPTFRNSEHNFI